MFSLRFPVRILRKQPQKRKPDRAQQAQFGIVNLPFGALIVPGWRGYPTPIRLVGGGVFLPLFVGGAAFSSSFFF